MCTGMIDFKKAMIRITVLEEELKSTRDGYEEEMTILMEKNDDLTRKLGVFMGDPAPGGDDDDAKEIRSEDYITSTTPTRTRTIAMMTMLMKLEQISWSLPQIKTFRRPPYQK